MHLNLLPCTQIMQAKKQQGIVIRFCLFLDHEVFSNLQYNIPLVILLEIHIIIILVYRCFNAHFID